jgi:thiopeptide-type bacteriocin biosynthesis protein
MVAWLGFRVDLTPPFEPLLTISLANWLSHKREQGLLKRWFFLRHSEGGLHLRLRMQPANETVCARLTAELKSLETTAEPPFCIQPHVYDRDIRAFGETRESVLAELLHAATSELALSLLSWLGEEQLFARRWILTAVTAAVVVERAIPFADLEDTMTHWRNFVIRTAADAGSDLRDSDHARHRSRASIVGAVASRLAAALDLEEAVNPTVLLVRRVRERGARGRFVAIHALHLFCNEMGLSIGDEHDLTRMLQAFLLTDHAKKALKR